MIVKEMGSNQNIPSHHIIFTYVPQTDDALRGRSLHFLSSDYAATKEPKGNDVNTRDAISDDGNGSRINLKSKIFNVFGYNPN